MKQILPWFEERHFPVRVAVIGDIILDEYLDGSVSRVSPEAPVLVHLVKGSSYSAGGAANAARNIRLAGGSADLFGVCGKDESANILFKLLQNDGININSVISVEDRPTHKKTRVTASNQQIIRIDWEKVQSLETQNQKILIDSLSKKEFDAILISDYGKGLLPRELLSKIFEFASKRKIPCVVDPKGTDFDRYRGCTVMTPNLRECCLALGIDEDVGKSGEELGRKLQERFGLNDVLVTMGAQGMIYVPQDRKQSSLYRKAQAKEVFDVSGAGDTVASIFTLGLGAKATLEETMNLANLAAAIVVGKWGTQPVTAEELRQAVQVENALVVTTQNKILSAEALPDLRKKLKTSRIVFTNGCFDILHAGHVDYLEKAKHLGDILVVGINTDDSIQKLKGPNRPVIKLEHRLKLMSALACVDYIVPFSDETPLKIIQTLSPDILVKGSDYTEDKIVGADHVKSLGGKVQTIELVPGISTSTIIEKISNKTLSR